MNGDYFTILKRQFKNLIWVSTPIMMDRLFASIFLLSMRNAAAKW